MCVDAEERLVVVVWDRTYSPRDQVSPHHTQSGQRTGSRSRKIASRGEERHASHIHAGLTVLQAYSQYASTARIWTRVHASECPECMKEDSEASDVPTSSFQAMALASAKRRESVAKIDDISTIRSLCHTQIGSGYSSAAAAQPLARSGSTNADLRHKPSFDMDARGKALTSLGSNTPSAHSIFAPTDSVAMSTATVTREMNKVSLNAKTMPSVKRRTHAVVRRGIKRL